MLIREIGVGCLLAYEEAKDASNLFGNKVPSAGSKMIRGGFEIRPSEAMKGRAKHAPLRY